MRINGVPLYLHYRIGIIIIIIIIITINRFSMIASAVRRYYILEVYLKKLHLVILKVLH
jgi:hypothetical protein